MNDEENVSMSLFNIFRLSGDDYLSTLDTDEFYKFIARYKFVIAYENGVCNDYITEKLWRPLTLGVVPIYFGAPNVMVKQKLFTCFTLFIFISHSRNIYRTTIQ